MVHIHGGRGGAEDLSSMGSGLRGLSPLGSDAEHRSASLGISPSAPLLWGENWARQRTCCRTVVALKKLRTTSVAWRYSLGHFKFPC